MRKNSSGFTLIELILVISLMMLLGTMGTTFTARFFTQNAVSNTRDQLVNDFKKAQLNAMMGKQNSNWGVNYASNTITLYKGASYATRTTALDETFSVYPNINITGFTDINFARATGIANASPLITISGLGSSQAIDMTSQGVPVSWFDKGYLFKKKITIDHTKVSGGSDLSNFPVLISLTDPDLKSIVNGGSVSNSSGYDIIFTNNTETIKLDHEIEKYNPVAGTMQMWVRVPTLSASADTVLYVYFGNSTISSSQENKTGVWDTNYKVVQHLEETSACAVTFTDSTSNGFNGSCNGSGPTPDSSGKIGDARAFNGSTQYISFTNSTIFNPGAGAFTVEAWIKTTSTTTYQDIMSHFDATGTGWGFMLNNGFATCKNGAVCIWDGVGAVGQLISGFANSTWTDVAVVRSGTTATLYANGSSLGTVTIQTTIPSSTNTERIGVEGDGTGPFSGSIDEVRYSNTNRSSGWISTEYNNESSPSTFFNVDIKTGQ